MKTHTFIHFCQSGRRITAKCSFKKHQWECVLTPANHGVAGIHDYFQFKAALIDWLIELSNEKAKVKI